MAATGTREDFIPEPPPKVGPDDALHRQVHDVVKGILGGNVVEPARKQLQDALAKPVAEKPIKETHRAPKEGVFGTPRRP